MNHLKYVDELAKWSEDHPIKAEDFPIAPPISAVELQETVDTMQRDIIAYLQTRKTK